ncbi:hypothetical protein [Endozoicomonas sp.]|uniref:hypothetical protein n=1 Tax=Endozoicomonas sp. TaxID=1892382 RepID=UPI00383BF13F
MAIDLKLDLQNYQSVFVLGLPEHQRYSLFQDLLGESLKEYMPVNYLHSGNNKTFILFNHPEEIGFVDTEQGLAVLGSELGANSDAEVYYLAVPSGSLPLGFVFIVPPPFQTKNFLPEHKSNPFLLDKNGWVDNLYGIIWCDAFPYAEMTNKYILDGIDEWFTHRGKAVNIYLSLFESNRNAVTDLADEGNDLQHAYSQAILARRLADIGPNTQPASYFRQLLVPHDSFISGQRKIFLSQVDKFSYFFADKVLFSTNYEFFCEDYIEEYLQPNRFDTLFSFDAWLRISHHDAGRVHLMNFIYTCHEKFLCSLSEDFFDSVNMPFLTVMEDKGYQLPFDELSKAMAKELKITADKLMRQFKVPLNKELKALSRLEFTEKVKNGKKMFTENVINFYKEQCAALIYRFLKKQVNSLKFN